MNQLPIRTSYERTFATTSQQYFNKYPRNWQLRVGGRIIGNICEKLDIRQLCVQPTGSGKSLLFQTIATFLKGVTLCLSPLLSLAADPSPGAAAFALMDNLCWEYIELKA